MIEDAMLDESGVRALAKAAALPLADDRVPAVTQLLQDWFPAASELSRIMSAPEHLAIMPITVFAHPPADPTE